MTAMTTQESKIEFVRKKNLCPNIVFVDGMWGSGKSMIAPILGSFPEVEKQRMNHNFEYLALLHHCGQIKSGAASSFLNIQADLDIFNSLISREVNLRPSDHSGIFKNPKTFQYLKRLFKLGSQNIVDEIEQHQPWLQIMTHNVVQVTDILFQTFGHRMKMVVMARHPLYMIEHWYNYIERVGT
ncbi:MAG: hypothetical protein AAF960_27910, partial [Bacteroidota bacterium]